MGFGHQLPSQPALCPAEWVLLVQQLLGSLHYLKEASRAPHVQPITLSRDRNRLLGARSVSQR